MGFATKAIHAGQDPDPTTGAIITPIYQTSTFVQERLGQHKGFEYARTHNPTRLALERNLAALEHGRFAYCFASGMSAITAILMMLKEEEHCIVSDNTYGGTFRLFDKVLKPLGLRFSYVNTCNIDEIRSAVCPQTKMLFIETPTNPIMLLTDIAAAAELCKDYGLKLVVDNTFMSPYFQQPLKLGADIVVHSTTKFLNGHSDSVGGAVILNDEADAEHISFLQNSVGAILSPFDSWLVLRGIKTLAVRMRQHEENGRAVANFLVEHPKVKKVFYPGLEIHPQYELAKRQMSGFGSMISFDVGSYEKAAQFLNSVQLCSLAESLGGVESLVCHPASMTHASVPTEERKRLGITDGLVRISVGIEDVEDIIADLSQALDRLS
ncbi:MAG: cystathionine gamma-synthase [Acidobacteriota bacterium]|nr:cystathionine gamma-synthase [Blastocatellia bacterium]MDW8413560.1 cystathionine gamma-synthase [Acidobacteriota bacterium]